jgi:hypothetical protein
MVIMRLVAIFSLTGGRGPARNTNPYAFVRPRVGGNGRGIIEKYATGVAYKRWLTMTTLSTWTKLAHDTMYLGSAPLGGGKDLLLLDYIDVYMIVVLPTA